MPSLNGNLSEIEASADVMRSALISGSESDITANVFDETTLSRYILHLEHYNTLFQYFKFFIGPEPTGRRIYRMDFSEFRLRPHEQMILYELQHLINTINKDIKGFRARDAHERVFKFFDNRLYREYFQIVKSEIENMIANGELEFSTERNKFSFWSDSRGYTLSAVFWKVIYLFNHLLHPFWPIFTEVIQLNIFSIFNSVF